MGRNRAARTCIELGDYLRGFESILGRLLAEGVDLSVDVPERPTTIVAAYPQLDQIVLNLVQNAAQAMPDGGLVRLSAEPRRLKASLDDAKPPVGPGDYVVIRVRDEGVGIEPEILERIFEPYFTCRKDAGGTGLGLANVYRAVQELGGGIRVDSAPDQGTTFSVYLPAASAQTERN